MQKERAKYKDLLLNAQNDLNDVRAQIENESEFKSKQESTLQELLEEKSKLVST